MPGIRRSSRIRSNGRGTSWRVCRATSAAGPLATTTGSSRQWVRIVFKKLPCVALSSTTSTRNASNSGGRQRGSDWSAPRRTPKRAVKWNVLPLADFALHPHAPSHHLRQLGRNGQTRVPMPPYVRAVEPSAWVKASKIARCLSSGMPMPVSLTEKCNVTASAVVAFGFDHRPQFPPASVNLSALPIRFTITCRSRVGSPISAAGTSGPMR